MITDRTAWTVAATRGRVPMASMAQTRHDAVARVHALPYPAGAPPREAAAVGAGLSGADARRWVGLGVAMLLVWSLSYLVRQPGPAVAEPFSLVGDFALEGMLLALTWLGAVVAGCLALLSGAVAIVDRSAE